jgi:hypothetical protein
MANYRNPNETPILNVAAPATYNIGNKPPLINWTVVIGDTASFRIYVEDDRGNPLDYNTTTFDPNNAGWTITGDFRRYSDNIGDDLLFTVLPDKSEFDDPGEFTVTLSATESKQLLTGDVFDIQLKDGDRVWTVCQGEMIMLGEITDQAL